MDKENEQKRIMRLFWQKNKERCGTIRSIDAVYNEYLTYVVNLVEKEKQENQNNQNNQENKNKQKVKPVPPPINKYIFRTYIRKNGYCNSGTEMGIKKKKQKKLKTINIKNN